MKYPLGVTACITGSSYVFFPGEMWFLALFIVLTILLMWLVDR